MKALIEGEKFPELIKFLQSEIRTVKAEHDKHRNSSYEVLSAEQQFLDRAVIFTMKLIYLNQGSDGRKIETAIYLAERFTDYQTYFYSGVKPAIAKKAIQARSLKATTTRISTNEKRNQLIRKIAFGKQSKLSISDKARQIYEQWDDSELDEFTPVCVRTIRSILSEQKVGHSVM